MKYVFLDRFISLLRELKESPKDSNKKVLIKIFSKVILFLVVILIYTTFLWIFDRNIESWNTPPNYSQNNKEIKFSDMFYYVSSTLFTVGFGDFTPKNTSVKLATVSLMFLAYIIFTY